MPASASTSPVRGRITAIPPKRPASAVDGRAPGSRGRSSCARRCRCCGSTAASTRSPARSSPPGRPVSSASNSRSRPVSPTGASSGTPRRAQLGGALGRRGPDACRRSRRPARRGRTVRASPSASGVPSRAWSAARGGIARRARAASRPGAGRGRPGGAASRPPAPVLVVLRSGSASGRGSVPNTRVRTADRAPGPRRRRGLRRPAGARRAASVARARPRGGRRRRSARAARRAARPGVSSACIAA